ncbi:MAG: D-Ala-D-Ala carboxypeptidase family metallohydrolase [Pseudomonadota bacterium]
MLFETLKQAQTVLARNWRWPHFSAGELACRCRGRFCRGAYWHDEGFLDALERMRADVGAPVIITSGHRCAQWNAVVGGAPRSQHKTVAADIRLVGQDRQKLKTAAERAGFSGLGLARTFLHVDRRARPAQWFYKGSEALWMRS